MSKVIYACSRDFSFTEKENLQLQKICAALTPDNLISPLQHRISVSDQIAFAITNHHFLFQELDESLLLGSIFDQQNSWHKPKTEFPDGSYAIFRNDEDFIEIVSDFAASRTIWYYFDENIFITSTSQRAIILFLRDFKFDSRVIPWMLSTGTLGPELSWDTRIRRIPPDASVILDKTNWAISLHQNEVIFLPQSISSVEQKQLLTNAIRKSIESLQQLDFSK